MSSFKQTILLWHKRYQYWNDNISRGIPYSAEKADRCKQELNKVLAKCSRRMREWCKDTGIN